MQVTPELIAIAWNHPSYILKHKDDEGSDAYQEEQLKKHTQECAGC